MKIIWNEVTWYSKLLALILFSTLPFLGFYLGVQYAGIEAENLRAQLQTEVIRQNAPRFYEAPVKVPSTLDMPESTLIFGSATSSYTFQFLSTSTPRFFDLTSSSLKIFYGLEIFKDNTLIKTISATDIPRGSGIDPRLSEYIGQTNFMYAFAGDKVVFDATRKRIYFLMYDALNYNGGKIDQGALLFAYSLDQNVIEKIIPKTRGFTNFDRLKISPKATYAIITSGENRKEDPWTKGLDSSCIGLGFGQFTVYDLLTGHMVSNILPNGYGKIYRPGEFENEAYPSYDYFRYNTWKNDNEYEYEIYEATPVYNWGDILGSLTTETRCGLKEIKILKLN